VCLNDGATLIDARPLDRVIAFDPATGALRCEAGVLLAEILTLGVPHGFFPPVTPGTRFVTLGRGIANDVHGKNHHHRGTFGRHVRVFRAAAFGRQPAGLLPYGESGAASGDHRGAWPHGTLHLGGDPTARHRYPLYWPGDPAFREFGCLLRPVGRIRAGL